MNGFRVDQIAGWWVVVMIRPGIVYDPSIGRNSPVETICGAFRNRDEAFDLGYALKNAFPTTSITL